MADLNPAQQLAVDVDARRVVCIAAPGAGKTRVLVQRVQRLLAAGWHPAEIVAVTFTRKAGREMLERLEAAGLPRRVVRRLTVTTFHAWAAGLLREFADVLGLHPRFTVRDEADREDLVRFVGAELRLKWTSPDRLWREERVRTRYRELLREAHAVDFDGLEFGLRRLLQDERVLGMLRSRYGHVLVDEGQDTSEDQQGILDDLAPANLFVVGDVSQAIYGFRGAHPDGFARLARDEAWRVVTLPTNYRSDPEIVAAATAIGRAMAEPGLEQDAARPAAGFAAVGVICGIPDDELEQGHLDDVADDLAAVLQAAAPDTCAVLAPTWARLDELAVVLAGRGIPHVVARRTMEVWATAEARWAIACLRVVQNPQDHLSLWQAVNAFQPRVSAGQWARARAASATTGDPVEHHLPPLGVVAAIQAARAEQARDPLDLDGPASAVLRTLSGEMEALHLGSRVLGLEAFEVEVRRWLATERLGRDVVDPLGEFLDWYAGRAVGDVEEQAVEPRVQLVTVHAAKGLEWPHVWVIGCDDGVLPRRGGDLEEQRRLFYVATTRARDRVRWCSEREPSRFIGEAGGLALEVAGG